MAHTLLFPNAHRPASRGDISLNLDPSTEMAAHLRRAPAALLDIAQDHLMTAHSQALIEEAVAVNHAQVADGTLRRYGRNLRHFDEYLVSVHGVQLLNAKRKHVLMFLKHLERQGGEHRAMPHPERAACSWCRDDGFRDGRKGHGWSPSYRKGYLSSIRFFYTHCLNDEDLPSVDPSARVPCPKITLVRGFTPTREEVQRLLDAPGKPRDRLLAYWMYFAPSRRATFSAALWRDVDLDAGVWRLVGKGGKVDVFPLHPLLRAEFKAYRRWQLKESECNPLMRAALTDADTAFVLLTRTGRQTRPETVAKLIEWRAIRAGVGVVPAPKGRRHDAPGGNVTLLSPHAMRRAWADHALNDPKNPVPIDVVAQVLNHADIGTTRRHYAPTKPERAQDALLNRRL